MRRALLLCLAAALAVLCGCTRTAAPAMDDMEPTGHMELSYADQFSVDYYGELARITVGDDQFLLAPEGARIPEGVSVPVLRQPVQRIYLASSSAMDLFLQAGALDCVTMTGTRPSAWAVPEIAEAVEEKGIRYVGKYSAPDYETIVAGDCGLAVENTMIYHAPDVKEQLERLGVPVLVERSSYESHPLGRVEWIKLWGLLSGRTEEAERFFDESVRKLNAVEDQTATGKTVCFFYITSSGYANVRKPGDYVSRMIELAGGSYLFPENVQVDENALSTTNMQLETFYSAAKDADILIYNSTVDGELETVGDLLEKSPLLADFKAVQTGDVWCTSQNMFQQVSGAADMIGELHAVFAQEDRQLTYLHRLSKEEDRP